MYKTRQFSSLFMGGGEGAHRPILRHCREVLACGEKQGICVLVWNLFLKFEAKKIPKYMGVEIKYYNFFHVFIICS